MGGRFLIPVSADVRTKAGDEVQVGVEADDAPRTLEIPADLAAALGSEPAARDAFAKLSYSGQRRYVLPVE